MCGYPGDIPTWWCATRRNPQGWASGLKNQGILLEVPSPSFFKGPWCPEVVRLPGAWGWHQPASSSLQGKQTVNGAAVVGPGIPKLWEHLVLGFPGSACGQWPSSPCGWVLLRAGYRRGYTLDLGLLFWVVRAGPALGCSQRGTGHSFKVHRLSLSGSDPVLPWPWMWGPPWSIHSYFTLFLTWVKGCELNFTSFTGLLFPDGAFYWNHQKSLLKYSTQVPRCVWLSVTSWTVALQAPLSMGILQARILEQIVTSYSRRSSRPRDWTRVSCVSCIGRQILYQQTYLGSLLKGRIPPKSESLWVGPWNLFVLISLWVMLMGL